MMTCLKEITDQNNIFVSNVFKAKAKEKYEETFFNGFYFKTQKCSFWGGRPIFQIFFSVSL